MLKVDSVNSLSSKIHKVCAKQSFGSTDTNRSQITELPVSSNTLVNVPHQYNKISEIKLPYDLTAYQYKLANGQRIVIIPKEGETVVKTYVNTGSMNEPDNVRGISHYIEHNLFNGSQGIDTGEFFKTIHEMGAETNACTSFATTNYYISSNLLNKGDLEKEIKLHATMLQSPKFALDMLEKEKGIVNSEINMYQGYADNLATNLTLKKLFNIQSTSQDMVAGTVQNINNITQKDVVDYFNNNYYPANMVTVITGDVKPDEAIDLVSKYFTKTNENTKPRKFEKLQPVDKTERQDFISDKTESTHAVLGFCGPKNDDVKSQICISLIDNMLMNSKTGRLDKALKPYNSYIHLNTEKISSRKGDNNAIFLDVATNEENCEKVLQEIFNHIYSLSSQPNYDEELELAKKTLVNDRKSSYEKSGKLNNVAAYYAINNTLENIGNYENILNSITKDDIINCAKQYFNLDKTVITVIHPDKKKNKDISFCGNEIKNAINPQYVNRYVTHNNFDIATNQSMTDVSALDISFDTETVKNANPVAGMILDTIIKEGSIYRNDTELNNYLQKNGITMNFSADTRGIGINAKFDAKNTYDVLRNACEVIYNPRFTHETFEYAKNKIIEDCSHIEKNANDKLLKELVPDTLTPEDIVAQAKNTTIRDVMDLYSYIINNSQGHVAFSAPLKENPQLTDILFRQISGMPAVKQSHPYISDIYKPVTETKVLTDTHNKPQAHVVECFKFKSSGNIKDIVAIHMLNDILGGNSSSRLFNDLREKQQLAYSVGSNILYNDNIGLLSLNIKTTTDSTNGETYNNIQKSIDGFNKNIDKIKTEKITEEELANAKLNFKNLILSSNETTIEKNKSLLNGICGFYGALEENEFLKVIDTITTDDLYNAANYIFSNKPTYSILATENTLKANEEYFRTL